MDQPAVFVSYSRADRDLVGPITTVLRITAVSVFRDEDSITPGKKWADEISRAISSSAKVVVFWSLAASQSSAVADECSMAIGFEKDVVPVLLDGTPLSTRLQPYEWVDLQPMILAAAGRKTPNRQSLLGAALSALGGLFKFGGVAGIASPHAFGPPYSQGTGEIRFTEFQASQIRSAFSNRLSFSE
jgi:hypothetical protein